MKHLGSKHEVTLVTFIRREDEVEDLAYLGRYCRDIKYCTINRSGRLNAIDAARSVLTRRSFIISRDWRPEMHAKILEALREPPDLIYVDHLQMFQYVPNPAPCPVLLDEHNVEWRIIERFAKTGTNTGLSKSAFARIEWPKLRACELEACRKANRVLTVTPQDKQILAEAGIPEEKLSALPIGVDTEFFKPIPFSSTSTRILSIGTMSWPPNADAVTYFSREIYPTIRKQSPDVTFSIVGGNPTADVSALPNEDKTIEVTGFVEDIRVASEDSAVFVVPLRIGSGMRVKILDAMAMGLPVVTTSIGCEGISLIPGEHALVADEPGDFAAAVISLINNPEERKRLGTAGRRLVENSYSWPPILSKLDDLLEATTIIPKTR